MENTGVLRKNSAEQDRSSHLSSHIVSMLDDHKRHFASIRGKLSHPEAVSLDEWAFIAVEAHEAYLGYFFRGETAAMRQQVADNMRAAAMALRWSITRQSDDAHADSEHRNQRYMAILTGEDDPAGHIGRKSLIDAITVRVNGLPPWISTSKAERYSSVLPLVMHAEQFNGRRFSAEMAGFLLPVYRTACAGAIMRYGSEILATETAGAVHNGALFDVQGTGGWRATHGAASDRQFQCVLRKEDLALRLSHYTDATQLEKLLAMARAEGDYPEQGTLRALPFQAACEITDEGKRMWRLANHVTEILLRKDQLFHLHAMLCDVMGLEAVGKHREALLNRYGAI